MRRVWQGRRERRVTEGRGASLAERVREVGDQVVRVFDADRQADEIVGRSRAVSPPRSRASWARGPRSATRPRRATPPGGKLRSRWRARSARGGADLERHHAAEVRHLSRGDRRVPDARRDPDSQRPLTISWRRGTPRRAAFPSGAHAHAERLQSAERQEHIHRAGDRADARSSGTRAARSTAASLVTIAPPIRSECPPRYFVTLWTTASAPSSSGRCSAGVANVLSTTTRAPASCATAATAAMIDDLEQRVRWRLDPDELRRRDGSSTRARRGPRGQRSMCVRPHGPGRSRAAGTCRRRRRRRG